MNHTSHFFEKTSLSWKQNTKRKTDRNKHVKGYLFMIPWRSEFSPFEFLKDVADRVTKAMCLRSAIRSSNRVTYPNGRSKPIAASVDYYRTAAVEDCIEFMHSSFSRSNSLSTPAPGQQSMHSFVRIRNFESSI